MGKSELERRRRLAVQRVLEGWIQRDVARFLGVHEDTVGMWMRKHRQGGNAALAAVEPPPPESRLSEQQWQEAASWVRTPATQMGYENDLWSSRRVTDQIRKRFGVAFHFRYVSARLLAMGITPQKPEFRPRERVQPEIDRWVAEEWPRILKKRPTSVHISC
jgi:transposase